MMPPTRRRTTRSGGRRSSAHELLPALHRAADRHHAARHRAVSAGRCRLREPAGGKPALDRVPDYSRQRQPARRRCRDHGRARGGPPRAAAWRDPRRQRADLGQFAGLGPDFHPVRPHPRHRRRSPGRAGCHQCRCRGPAGRHAVAAELQEIKSLGLANPHSGADIEDNSGQRHLRRRRHRHRAAHLAGRGRGRGYGRRRRAARHTRARQSHAAVHRGPQHRGRAFGHRQRQCPFAARHHRGCQAGDRHRFQRPTAHRRRLQENHPQDRQRRRRALVQRGRGQARRRATRARRRCSTTSPRSC